MFHDAAITSPRSSFRTALAIGLLYAVTGLAWIVWSDAAVEAASPDRAWLATAQQIKGVLYVVVTAACLVWLVYRVNRRVVEATLFTRAALDRQQDQFRQLHESLGDVVWLADAESRRILYVSPSFEDVYGRSTEEFVRNPRVWLDVVVEEDHAAAAASVAELERLGASSTEYRIQRPDGTIRWISDRKRVIRDELGAPRMIGGVGEDITDSKMLHAMQDAGRPELASLLAERAEESERQQRGR